jgi:DNA adenine methylase
MNYTRNELVALCKEKGIKGYSNKTKDELIKLLTPLHSLPLKTYISPLRYPGGKSRAIPILERYINTHFSGRTTLLSPFLGGASFELHMKSKGYTIKGNDLFNPLYIFWRTLQDDPDQLIEHIRKKMPPTKESFQKMRTTICSTDDNYDKASSYFVINRSSFSGATLCGGFSQQAATGRLTESSLQRLRTCDVSEMQLTNLDCCEFLSENPETADTIVYADPPYYIDTYIYGKDGDMHENFNHEAFATAIKKRSDWMISYNDCEYIRNLYADCRIFKESWSYGMNASKKSSEIIILPPQPA